MRYLLILFFIPCKCFAQDTITLNKLPFFDTTNSIEFRIMDDSQSYVSMLIDENHDTTYTVVGDTLTAIKGLFKLWGDKQKEIDMWRDIVKRYREMLLNLETSAKEYLKLYIKK